MKSTFSVLVTVEHDPQAGHSATRIAEAIQTALEEGTSNTASFLSAQVDAFKGMHLVSQRFDNMRDVERLSRIQSLHSA